MKAYLEKQLSRTTMYMLVVTTLLAILVVAFILASFGGLAFSPLELLATTLLFCATGVISSYLFGKLYSAPSHLPSALITALILSCIFTPSLDMIILLQYAFISVVAQASKYVITRRRRHIFNPAAFGAFVGILLKLAYTSWWIATPLLLPVILITAFLVLYKTRQLPLGGVFIALAVIIIVGRGVFSGEDFWYMLSSTLSSWPLIFVAGFMLSEPLTLPPKKEHKLLVGLAVALLVALPLQIGWISGSPIIALLIGNMLALGLAFKQRADLGLTLSARRQLTPTVYEYSFTTIRPVHFQPGQYIELTLPHRQQDWRGSRRMFSITSSPDQNMLSLGIKFADGNGSTFKTALAKLPIGSKLQTTGVNGDFTLPVNPNQKLLFIAGGIGVTPFISQLERLKADGRDAILLYFVRSPHEIAYKQQLDESTLVVHYFTAQNNTGMYHSANVLTDEILQQFVPDIASRLALVSGPPAMVASVRQLVDTKAAGVKTDYFAGF